MPSLRENRSGDDGYSSWVSHDFPNSIGFFVIINSIGWFDFYRFFNITNSLTFLCIVSVSNRKKTIQKQIGLMFLFNLIVGTGALTLPSAFAKTGWLLGLVLITILAFISYMTVTFVIETMACANAIYYWGRLEQLKREREREGVSKQNNHFLRLRKYR